MTAGTGSDSDKTIGAFLDSLFSKSIVDNIVENNAAPGMNPFINFDLGT